MSELNIKIGSRILSDDEARVLLPSYDLIYKQINNFAQTANEDNIKGNETVEKLNRNILKEDREFSKHHNNVFSILGARGTGKTSILLTIKYRIQNNNENNKLNNITPIVLPIIVPDDMEQSGDIIGWILGSFKPIVEKFDKEYIEKKKKESDFGCNKSSYESEISKSFKKVLKYYQFRKDTYYSVIKEQYMGKLEFIDDTTSMLVADRELVSSFDDFIEKLVETIKIKYDKESQKKQPMIFIFFDDVDLSNDKCPDVFNTILRYLSNKNIVVFVGGDYKQFVENLTLNYLKTDNLLTSDLMSVDFITPEILIEIENNATSEQYTENKPFFDIKDYANKPTIQSTSNKNIRKSKNSALEMRKKLSASFIKKVLSPATRYELKYMNNEQKANFSYTTNGILLPAFHELIKIHLNLDIMDNRFKIYLELFDKTPRSLINVYYYIYVTMKEDDISIEKLMHFLSLIIDSNDILIDYKSEIENSIILIKSENLNKISIDYRHNIDSKSKDSLLIILALKFFTDIAKQNKMIIQEFNFSLFKDFLWKHFNNRLLIFPNDGFIESFYMELLYAISPNEFILIEKLNSQHQNNEYPIAQFINIIHDITIKNEYSNNQSLIESFNWAYEKNSQWIINIFSQLVIFFPFSNDFLIKDLQYYISEFSGIFKGDFNFDLSEFNYLQTSYKQMKTKKILGVEAQKEITIKVIEGVKLLREQFIGDIWDNRLEYNVIPNNISDLMLSANNLHKENQNDIEKNQHLMDLVVKRIDLINNILPLILKLEKKINYYYEILFMKNKNTLTDNKIIESLNYITDEINKELNFINEQLYNIPIETIENVIDLQDYEWYKYNSEIYNVDISDLKDFLSKNRKNITKLKHSTKNQKDIFEQSKNKCKDIIDSKMMEQNSNNEKLFKAYIRKKKFESYNYKTIYANEFDQIKGRLENFYSFAYAASPKDFENLQTISKYLLKIYLTYHIETKCSSLLTRLDESDSEIFIDNASNKIKAYELRFKLLEEILNLNNEENEFVKWFKSETYTGKGD